jgi:hypothetical protein
MTTTTAATPGAVTSLLGQQGQASTAQAGQVDVQGIFDSILKHLPAIVNVVQGVVSGQSASPQGFTPQSYGSYGGMQTQNVDPMGLFDSIFKQLPNIIRVVQGVVTGQSASPQGLQPQTNGGMQTQNVDPMGLFDSIFKQLPNIIRVVQGVVTGQSAGPQTGYQPQGAQPQSSQPQQLDPQFLQFLLPALPSIIGLAGQLLRPNQAGPQGFQPQMFGGAQGQQIDPQGFFDNLLKQLPGIIQVVQGVVSGQSATPQSTFGTPYPGYPGYPFSGWPYSRPAQPIS